MTAQEIVESVWGPVTPQDASDLLWMGTAWPACDLNYAKEQLLELYGRSGGSIPKALALVDDEVRNAMTSHEAPCRNRKQKPSGND